jgi:ferritin-like metal-binding protein YciE
VCFLGNRRPKNSIYESARNHRRNDLKQLGRGDCASVLKQTLDEEKATDAKLTAIAEQAVNRKAA